MLDVEKFIAGLHKYLGELLSPLAQRVKALEQRPAPERGEKGDPGAQGPAGEPGPTGEKGDAGTPGADGAAGPQGPSGPAGEKGDTGEPGPAGERGPAGEKGERGEPGPAGPAGPTGEKGDPGVAGERGEKGEPGPAGPAGERGQKGDIGEPGPAGATGERGETGPRGEKGEPGIAGKDGAPGADGRDALQIDIHPAISPTKSYHAGAYACRAGGVWKAVRPTDPLPEDGDAFAAGWACVWRGIDEMALEVSANMRKVGVALRLSDGQAVIKEARVSTTIYRGIWNERGYEIEGTTYPYERGDQVTRDGSTWTLIVDEQRGYPGQPGTETGWVLSAKKGRDGLKGERGDRGAPGRDGKPE